MLIIGEIGKVSPTASCMHFQRNNLYIFCFLHRHSDLIYFCLNNPIYAIRLKLLVIWEKQCIKLKKQLTLRKAVISEGKVKVL